MIHVCSLARLHETVEGIGASHVVSLIGLEDRVDRPASIAPQNHLWLQMHDISEPLDGHIMPEEDHVAALIDFVRGWDRRAPLVVHCYMGISRSTASAYASVCALNLNHWNRKTNQNLLDCPGRIGLELARFMLRKWRRPFLGQLPWAFSRV